MSRSNGLGNASAFAPITIAKISSEKSTVTNNNHFFILLNSKGESSIACHFHPQFIGDQIQGVSASIFFSFAPSCRAFQASKKTGMSEIRMIAMITNSKFFCTKGMVPKK